MERTIYDEIGGALAVAVVVDRFYERLLADATVSHYFVGRDLTRLKAHQRALVTVALGGMTERYAGRLMGPAHAGLAITDDAFDRVLMHLEAVLLDAAVAPTTVGKVMAILEPLRPEVVQAPVAARS